VQEILLGRFRRISSSEVYGHLANNMQANRARRLGISDLKLTGFALQTKWLWLQKIDHDRAWSRLPIKTTPKVQAFFKASTFTIVGDGR
jgi:hypothetical protein